MEYDIQYKGLKEGRHEFVFQISKAFFQMFPESEIQEGNVQVDIELIKRSTGLEVTFISAGEVQVECDRCLDPCMQSIDAENKMFFEFKHESREVTDELVYLAESEDVLDLSSYIYEFILLALPLQRVHDEDEDGNSLCNKEMLARLQNNMHVTNEDDEIVDPRWDKLRGLIN